jgi:7-cyano-7-deazaguanine reductase
VPEIRGGGVLGQKVKGARRQLDTFELPKGNQDVRYSSDEVVGWCPITGAPDFYDVDIRLYKSNRGLESKSIKLYLQSWMHPNEQGEMEGLFCESFADRICGDVFNVLQNDNSHLFECEVTVTQKPRGGVTISSTSKREVVASF